jgi:hypothetical protein
MLGPAKADTPRTSFGDVGISVEEAKAKAKEHLMARRGGESCDGMVMREGVPTR